MKVIRVEGDIYVRATDLSLHFHKEGTNCSFKPLKKFFFMISDIMDVISKDKKDVKK